MNWIVNVATKSGYQISAMVDTRFRDHILSIVYGPENMMEFKDTDGNTYLVRLDDLSLITVSRDKGKVINANFN